MLLIFFQLSFGNPQTRQVVFVGVAEACDTSSCSRDFLFVVCVVALSIEVLLGALLDLGVIDLDSHCNVSIVNIFLDLSLLLAPLLLQ